MESESLNKEEIEIYKKQLKHHEMLSEELNKLNKIKESTVEWLHRYNEIKDATQIVLGAIARSEGITLKEAHEIFSLPLS